MAGRIRGPQTVRASQFVFAYGSLTARRGPALTRELRRCGFLANASGVRRRWGVAMDNRRDLPGYKYYTDEAGWRPPVFVAFLDLVEAYDDPTTTVNGVCLPADEDLLAALDRRERNYDRVDISERVPAGGARVWAYVGSPAGRDRFTAARRDGTAVIAAGYLRAVEAGFAALGGAEHESCRASLHTGGLTVVELTRHDLPCAGAQCAGE